MSWDCIGYNIITEYAITVLTMYILYYIIKIVNKIPDFYLIIKIMWGGVGKLDIIFIWNHNSIFTFKGYLNG